MQTVRRDKGRKEEKGENWNTKKKVEIKVILEEVAKEGIKHVQKEGSKERKKWRKKLENVD
jgi:hypothetical protein